MKLIVNGEALDATARTLQDLLTELDLTGPWLATAVDGDFVPAGERIDCTLRDGAAIEILSPMQGG
ncbi:sulfur carrier protein ThiS [Aestuariispira ectoiniformans]|uniref:sulfur carrier protein ThiS n=1 Tax=Aestuariispira ectoiniformans TaxID=2775080 RepID=UPI00223B4CBA|nr:sulfur carrier protein ThiS [Aestuariispira ectoiniformans]